MENEQQIQQPAKEAPKTDRQLLEEIHSYSRKTKNYMFWQLVITVALVVVPLIGALILVPFMLRTLGSAYGVGADLNGISPDSIKQILQ
ncbi:MAG TPA: hypothetical protein VHQ20_02890 [Patescibacteria group bacterium]|jgi:hypothetical protein|nr:hypothetical protein [Patescibacteria group bacterium]